jgi:hypothetical protein
VKCYRESFAPYISSARRPAVAQQSLVRSGRQDTRAESVSSLHVVEAPEATRGPGGQPPARAHGARPTGVCGALRAYVVCQVTAEATARGADAPQPISPCGRYRLHLCPGLQSCSHRRSRPRSASAGCGTCAMERCCPSPAASRRPRVHRTAAFFRSDPRLGRTKGNRPARPRRTRQSCGRAGAGSWTALRRNELMNCSEASERRQSRARNASWRGMASQGQGRAR